MRRARRVNAFEPIKRFAGRPADARANRAERRKITEHTPRSKRIYHATCGVHITRAAVREYNVRDATTASTVRVVSRTIYAVRVFDSAALRASTLKRHIHVSSNFSTRPVRSDR